LIFSNPDLVVELIGNTGVERFFKRIELCPYKVTLIGYEKDQEFRNYCNVDIGLIHQKWIQIRALGSSIPESLIESKLSALGELVFPFKLSDNKFNLYSLNILRCKGCSNNDHYLIYLGGVTKSKYLLVPINYLANHYQIMQGNLPVHSAGIIYDNNLYLFAGFSGAGKSTIAKLSQAIGAEILDEDQVLLRRTTNLPDRYVADAWGYSSRSVDIPLKAIFFIKQDIEDKIIPLGQTRTASLLIKHHLETVGYYAGVLPNAFNFATSVALNIPGYELHFRKSADFWKLIDQLPFSN
jgi:hypothetical protein